MNADLMALWTELAGKLAAGGLHAPLPAHLGYAESFPDSPDVAGSWEPETRRMWVLAEYAPAPLLVRDVLIHEITHSIHFEMTGGSDSGGINGGVHGDLFVRLASRVAGILGDTPSPVPALVNSWPYGQRPISYFGPNVRGI